MQHKLLNGVTAVEELAESQKARETSEDTTGHCNDDDNSCQHRGKMLELFIDKQNCTTNVPFLYPLDSVPEEVKSVDILAALPTPPHNQNEDVRYAVEFRKLIHFIVHVIIYYIYL